TGTVTLIPPRGGRKFTLAEITDLLNEALGPQKYILVRRAASFTLLHAEEKIDPTLLPRVRPEEVEKRGRTELVRTTVPLTDLPAGDILPDVRKLLGPFGEAVALDTANQLLLQDTAGNLRHILEVLQGIKERKPPKK